MTGKEGLLETAHHGTVLLDEVGEMSLATQAKLLRVIEERKLRRVGGVVSRRVESNPSGLFSDKNPNVRCR